jgi:hypothetical protein
VTPADGGSIMIGSGVGDGVGTGVAVGTAVTAGAGVALGMIAGDEFAAGLATTLGTGAGDITGGVVTSCANAKPEQNARKTLRAIVRAAKRDFNLRTLPYRTTLGVSPKVPLSAKK